MMIFYLICHLISMCLFFDIKVQHSDGNLHGLLRLTLLRLTNDIAKNVSEEIQKKTHVSS